MDQERLGNLNKQEEKMATLIEEAKAYESHATGNIADLSEVSTNLEVVDKTATNDEGKEFNYKIVNVDGKDYRVPNSVLKSLKAITDDNPKLKKFKVKKSGAGLSTEYTVIPLN